MPVRIPTRDAVRKRGRLRALVTGATGFIGSSLAGSLANSGWDVSVLVRPSSLTRLKNPERFKIIEADLKQPKALSNALANTDVDVVLHAAAIRNRWGTSQEAYYAINVEATRSLLDAVSEKTRRFVYVSSVGVFGRPGVLGIDETFPIDVSSQWDYHSSKAASEKITLDHSAQIETVVVRPTITYGPGDIDGMVTRLIQMVRNKRFVRIGRGENHVHLTHIDDITAGLRLAMTHPQAPGNIFILAGQEPINMKDLIRLIEILTSVNLPKWYIPAKMMRAAGAMDDANTLLAESLKKLEGA